MLPLVFLLGLSLFQNEALPETAAVRQQHAPAKVLPVAGSVEGSLVARSSATLPAVRL